MDKLEYYKERIEKDQFTPVRELIFQYLREAIVSGKLEPGSHLIEETLAKELNVSRTPIREAIRKLDLEGLVQRSPRRGVVVRNFSLADIEEIYAIRSALEGFAARLAAKHIEPRQIEKLKSLSNQMKENMKNGKKQEEMENHKEWLATVYAASKNKRLERLLTDYADYLQFFRAVSLQGPGRSFDTGDEHDQLTHAIELRDAKLAERIATEHVEKAKEAFFSQYLKA